MFVNRRTFHPKRGKTDEVLAFCKKAAKGMPHAARVYESDLGTFDIVAVEAEFESLAEYERVWKALAEATTPAEWEQWLSLTENGGTNEIWQLR